MMKFIFIIYSILVLHYVIADECSNLFDHKHSTVTFSEEQFKNQPAFFYSLGRKLKKNKEETNEFIYGSFLYLGENHTPYTAKTCIDSTLTVSNPTDDSELHLKIDTSLPTEIIRDPISEIPELQTTCYILSFPGQYLLTIKEPFSDTIYDTKFIVNTTSRKVLFYNIYASNITYDYAYLPVDDKKKQISNCTDYLSSNSVLYVDRSREYKFITNVKKIITSDVDDFSNWCTLMSVPGLYQLFNHRQLIGEFKTYYGSNYESFNDLNESKYSIEFNHVDNLPIYTDIRNKHTIIGICSINNRKNYLYSDDYTGNYIYFDSVNALYQDTRQLKLGQSLIKANATKKYNLDKQINQIEINALLSDLGVPDDEIKKPQQCKKFIYPGTYNLSIKGEPAMIMHVHDFMQIYTRHNRKNDDLEARYQFIINSLNGEKKIQTYECKDIFNANGYSNSVIFKVDGESNDKGGIKQFIQVGPELLITSVEHDDIPLSLDDIKLVENESWLDDTNSKIKLRTNKECIKLEQRKTYKAANINSEFIVKIGEIEIRKFHRLVGYSVIFKYGKNVNDKDKSYLESFHSYRKVSKNFGSSILSRCTSNHNGNSFYTIGFDAIKEDGAYHSHNDEIRQTQLKYKTLTEVNEHDIKK